VDTGVPTASLLPHGRLLGGPCFTTAQAGMQFNRHTDAPLLTFHISVPRIMRVSTPSARARSCHAMLAEDFDDALRRHYFEFF
jgi:hypothetical protein